MTACGGGLQLGQAVDERWQWDGGAEATRVLTRIGDAEGPPRVPAAVGVTGLGVVGRTLPDGARWTYQAKVDVLPTLVADLVLFTAEGRLVALDVRTGTLRYSVDVGGRRLEGAGSDGNRVVALLVDKDDARPDQIRALGPHGEDLMSATTKARLGTPAAVEGLGLLPYSGQYVGAFELDTGRVVGRLLYRDGIHTVTADERGILLFGHGVTELHPTICSHPESQALLMDAREFPGEPSWPKNGSKPRPARGEPIFLAAHVERGAQLHFAQDRYVAVYYQIISGFDHGTNRLVWSNHLPHSALGGDAGLTDTTLCLEDGSILRASHEDGGLAPYGALEQRLKACVVTAPSGPVTTASRPQLTAQIVETLSETGADMAAMQRLLLEELASVKDRGTTRALLDLAQDPEVSSELARYAGQLLEKQSEGGEEMVRALREFTAYRERQERALAAQAARSSKRPTGSKGEPDPATGNDSARGENEVATLAQDEVGTQSAASALAAPSEIPTLSNTTTLRMPPVASIAVALTRLKTPGSAEALAPYLEDRSLSADQVAAVMHAIYVLGDAQQVEAVFGFLMDYKNTGGEETLLDALSEAAVFLFRYGDEERSTLVVTELSSQLTHPALRERVGDFRKKAEKSMDSQSPTTRGPAENE